jgi:hypothetical protein
MPERDKRIPDWARRERQRDLDWIQENFAVFRLASIVAFADTGRGALVVDTTWSLPEAGNPFAYFNQEQIEQEGYEDAMRMAQAYDPTSEFIVVLLKEDDHLSTYRVGIRPAGRQGNVPG